MTGEPTWARPAQQDLRRVSRESARRVLDAVERLAATGQGDVKSLQGRDRRWRLRVGDLRAIFTHQDGSDVVHIVRVLPRGRAYRD